MIRSIWLALLLLSGCERESCLGGENQCRIKSPCQKLRFSCDSPSLEVRRLEGPSGLGGLEAAGARGDVLLSNGEITAVIAGLGNSNYLDPSGGGLIDLARKGGPDALNLILQAVGVLPDDSPNYTSLEILDERPTRVAVQLRGTLLHRENIPIATLYEVRPCEPGVRVRTELVNGTTESQLWALSDGFYWSSRSLLPFTPGPGFNHPSFGLLDIDDAYKEFPLLAASTHTPPHSAITQVGCNLDTLEGFQSTVVSTSGRPRTVVPARAPLVFERFIGVSNGGDVASPVDLALELRAQLHGDRAVTLRGSVGRAVRDEGDVSIVVSDESGARWTQVVPRADGGFSARVPAGKKYTLELHNLGRVIASHETARADGDLDVGTLAADDNPRVRLSVKDGDGNPLDAILYAVPADAATRAASEGSLYGNFDSCAPWLGTPTGSSPACNRILVAAKDGGTATVAIAKGNYHFYGFHGPFYTLARATVAVESGTTPVELVLRPLPLVPPGALSADLHVHGGASFDSTIPDGDRVLSFAAAAVDVIIATDHDVIHDYSPVLSALGLAGKLSTVNGIETTGHIPFNYVPGDEFPRVVGHYNFWPLRHNPSLPRGGAPPDEFFEPGALFDRLEPLFSALPIMQLNHPWAEADFGRDLGFPRALGLNLTKDLPASDDGTPAGVYVRAPRGGHRNDDHHTQEVMNGSNNDHLIQYRAFWYYTLNQGQVRTGTANSDSHSLTDNTVGSPRNLVLGVAPFEIVKFNQALRDGRVLGTNGPIIEATVDDTGFGVRPFKPAPGARLRIRVEAAPFVPVAEIRIVVNGVVAKTIRELMVPADPFGTAELVRYAGDLDLAEILPASGDAWIVVEAGAPLPLFADLDGDGMPDTADNNGDGRVDERDVEMGEETGPLTTAPPPGESHPAFHFAQVVTGGYPFAFTNPFVLDRDGNGRFDAPGARK